MTDIPTTEEITPRQKLRNIFEALWLEAEKEADRLRNLADNRQHALATIIVNLRRGSSAEDVLAWYESAGKKLSEDAALRGVEPKQDGTIGLPDILDGLISQPGCTFKLIRDVIDWARWPESHPMPIEAQDVIENAPSKQEVTNLEGDRFDTLANYLMEDVGLDGKLQGSDAANVADKLATILRALISPAHAHGLLEQRHYLATQHEFAGASEGDLSQDGFEACREMAAAWHDVQQQGGHCGESTSEKIIRQRRNRWHEEAAMAIRTLKNTGETGDGKLPETGSRKRSRP